MFRVIPEILQTIATYVPPWALALAAVALSPVVVPAWLRYVRGKRIRNRLRTAFRATDPEARQALVDEAFALAGERPADLVHLADAAHAMGLKAAVRRAIDTLERLDALPGERRRLEAQISAHRRQGAHPVQEAVVIERFLDQGMLVAARERLDGALERFPEDPELLELAGRLREAESAASEGGASDDGGRG